MAKILIVGNVKIGFMNHPFHTVVEAKSLKDVELDLVKRMEKTGKKFTVTFKYAEEITD